MTTKERYLHSIRPLKFISNLQITNSSTKAPANFTWKHKVSHFTNSSVVAEKLLYGSFLYWSFPE